MLYELAEGKLTWWPELEMGFYPVECGLAPYNKAYFDRLVAMSETDIGKKLMRSRVSMVQRHHGGPLVDVGCGSGAFITERLKWRQATLGWDVNPHSLEWLANRDLLLDPHLMPVDAVSMWDVLEHMPDFRLLLGNVKKWLFISIPIFDSMEHVLESKHYRTDEHYWYFTRGGLESLMRTYGFDLVEENDDETKLGREDIMSFAFCRR